MRLIETVKRKPDAKTWLDGFESGYVYPVYKNYRNREYRVDYARCIRKPEGNINYLLLQSICTSLLNCLRNGESADIIKLVNRYKSIFNSLETGDIEKIRSFFLRQTDVYLAVVGNKIKVGTSSKIYKRWVDQEAQIGVKVAKAPRITALLLEKSIYELLSDYYSLGMQIPSKYKLEHFINNSDDGLTGDWVEKRLRNIFDDIMYILFDNHKSLSRDQEDFSLIKNYYSSLDFKNLSKELVQKVDSVLENLKINASVRFNLENFAYLFGLDKLNQDAELETEFNCYFIESNRESIRAIKKAFNGQDPVYFGDLGVFRIYGQLMCIFSNLALMKLLSESSQNKTYFLTPVRNISLHGPVNLSAGINLIPKSDLAKTA